MEEPRLQGPTRHNPFLGELLGSRHLLPVPLLPCHIEALGHVVILSMLSHHILVLIFYII